MVSAFHIRGQSHTAKIAKTGQVPAKGLSAEKTLGVFIAPTINRYAVWAAFGIDGDLQRLGGENLNYLLTTGNDRQRIVKVWDEVSSAVLDMEFRSIAHAVAAGIHLELPEMLENEHGNYFTRIKNHKKTNKYLILMKYIEGVPLDSLTDISIDLLKNVGFSLAEYDNAMRFFEHPSAQRSHTWKLLEADRHRPVTERPI